MFSAPIMALDVLNSPTFNALIGPIITILAGIASSYVMTYLRKGLGVIDKLPAAGKQAVMVVLAFFINKLTALVNMPLPVDPTTWSADLVNALLVALASLGVYNLRKTTTK